MCLLSIFLQKHVLIFMHFLSVTEKFHFTNSFSTVTNNARKSCFMSPNSLKYLLTNKRNNKTKY